MASKNFENQSKQNIIAEISRLKKELKKRKKYGLVWEEKPEEVVEMCKTKLPALKEVKGKEIITDKKEPVNLLIEGDNYHALSVLNYTHEKSIDVIYIDPPYNTGKEKEWKFNDQWVDKEDVYRHSFLTIDLDACGLRCPRPVQAASKAASKAAHALH